MPAESGIAAADDLDRRLHPLTEAEQALRDRGGESAGGVLGQAAGVGQHEAGGAGCGQPGRVLGILEHVTTATS